MQFTVTPARAKCAMASRTSMFKIKTFSSAKNAARCKSAFVKADLGATFGMRASFALVNGFVALAGTPFGEVEGLDLPLRFATDGAFSVCSNMRLPSFGSCCFSRVSMNGKRSISCFI